MQGRTNIAEDRTSESDLVQDVLMSRSTWMCESDEAAMQPDGTPENRNYTESRFGLITISIRRFLARPAAVSLLATGLVSP